jgi:ribosomal protein L7/L12
MAREPAMKIAAIKVYREQNGVDLAKATRAVEEYISSGGGRA